MNKECIGANSVNSIGSIQYIYLQPLTKKSTVLMKATKTIVSPVHKLPVRCCIKIQTRQGMLYVNLLAQLRHSVPMLSYSFHHHLLEVETQAKLCQNGKCIIA